MCLVEYILHEEFISIVEQLFIMHSPISPPKTTPPLKKGDCFQEAVRPLHKKAFDVIMGWRVMGTNRTERVLPVGMVVTAIGEVSKVKDIGGHLEHSGGLLRHQGDVLVMRAPQHGPFILSKRSLGSIVSSLNEVSRICR